MGFGLLSVILLFGRSGCGLGRGVGWGGLDKSFRHLFADAFFVLLLFFCGRKEEGNFRWRMTLLVLLELPVPVWLPVCTQPCVRRGSPKATTGFTFVARVAEVTRRRKEAKRGRADGNSLPDTFQTQLGWRAKVVAAGAPKEEMLLAPADAAVISRREDCGAGCERLLLSSQPGRPYVRVGNMWGKCNFEAFTESRSVLDCQATPG